MARNFIALEEPDVGAENESMIALEKEESLMFRRFSMEQRKE